MERFQITSRNSCSLKLLNAKKDPSSRFYPLALRLVRRIGYKTNNSEFTFESLLEVKNSGQIWEKLNSINIVISVARRGKSDSSRFRNRIALARGPTSKLCSTGYLFYFQIFALVLTENYHEFLLVVLISRPRTESNYWFEQDTARYPTSCCFKLLICAVVMCIGLL